MKLATCAPDGIVTAQLFSLTVGVSSVRLLLLS